MNRIAISLFAYLLAAAALAATDTNAPVRVLVVKQDVPQYNAVFTAARERLLAVDRRAFVVEAVDLDATGAMPAAVADRDIVVSVGTKAFTAAISRFPDAAHVFGMVINVDRAKIAAMSRKSKKMVGGVSLLSRPAAYIDYANQIQGDVNTIGALYKGDPFGPYLDEFRAAAEAAGVALVVERVNDKKDLIGRLDAVLQANVDAFLILPDFSIYNRKSLEHVIVTTYNRGIPCIGPSESFVTSGALWAFNVQPERIGRQIADLVVGDAPDRRGSVVYYAPSSVAINMLVAEQLDIAIPYRVRKDATLIDLRRRDAN